jgi:hypothetical protein
MYWFSPSRDESSWESPYAADARAGEDESASAAAAAAAEAQRVADDEAAVTAAAVVAAAAEEAEAAAAAAAAAASCSDWEIHEAEDGAVYYFSPSRDESSWDVPADYVAPVAALADDFAQEPEAVVEAITSDWEQHETEDGTPYWFSPSRDESSWETPAGWQA